MAGAAGGVPTAEGKPSGRAGARPHRVQAGRPHHKQQAGRPRYDSVAAKSRDRRASKLPEAVDLEDSVAVSPYFLLVEWRGGNW